MGWHGKEIEKCLSINHNIILNVGTFRVTRRLFSLPSLSHVSEILPVVLNFLYLIYLKHLHYTCPYSKMEPITILMINTLLLSGLAS